MMNVETITFNDVELTEAGLAKITGKNLLDLRNVVASNLGRRDIKSFHTHTKGVASTWKLLQEWNAQGDEGDSIETPVEEVPEPAEPKTGGELPRCERANSVERFSRGMAATVHKVKTPPKGMRDKYWPHYEDGMTIYHLFTTEGLDPLKAKWWEKHGFMNIKPATDDDFAKMKAMFEEGTL